MAAKKAKRKKLLTYFYDHDDQEAKDLQYGAQKEGCKKHLRRDTAFVDRSIEGNWSPDED